MRCASEQSLRRNHAVKSLRFVYTFSKRYAASLVVAIVSMVFLVGVGLVAPQVVRQLVAAVSSGMSEQASLVFIARLALVLLGVYAARAVLRFISNYAAHVAGWGVVSDVRQQIYEHLQKLTLRFYENQQTGQLMSRMINDSDRFEMLIAHAVPGVLVNLLTLIGVSLVLISMSWKLMLLTLIPVPLIVLAMRGFALRVRPAFRNRQRELAELNATLNDNISGIREIKAFTREDSEAARIGKHIVRYRDSVLVALKMLSIFEPFIEFSSALGTIVVIYFGGRLAFGKVLPVQDLVAFFLYLDMFYQPVRALSTVWENVQEALAGADRIEELLKQEPEVSEQGQALALEGKVKGDIVFRDVCFHYVPEAPVLEHIDLDIPANSVVALVGPTGVGKTTLASLIPRFYEVCAGSITLDGHDIRDIKLRSLREQVSVVLQDVFLFHGTVRENILFGRPGASEEEMVRAAQVANAHEFITRLSDGYDTLIGERGVKLSGGQKQRLSIARAVLKDAPILILDEATSSVDTETEMLIQQALERLMVGRTTIIIAHRLSTIRAADLIVVLEGRQIAEMGTHEQLMTRGGLYQHLNEVQSHVDEDQLEAIRTQRRVALFDSN
jgi:ATP-binding cassette, subfamily B, bacterial